MHQISTVDEAMTALNSLLPETPPDGESQLITISNPHNDLIDQGVYYI